MQVYDSLEIIVVLVETNAISHKLTKNKFNEILFQITRIIFLH